MPAHARRAALVAVSLLGLAAAVPVQARTPPPIMGKAASAPAPKPAPAPAMFGAPEYVMGDPRAKVTVIEYASASCPHCARFDVNQFPPLKAKYIDTGKVRYVFREFLTEPVQLAAAGFLLARCAGQAHYWQVVEDVFHSQNEIYATHDVQGVFERIAKSVGLTPAQVDACLTDKAALAALNARVDDAVDKQHVNETPTFLINGVVFKGDPKKEIDFAELSAAIDPLLAQPHARAARRRAR